ncbi:cyclin-dependent kinase inhibitor 1C [Tachyglossus aculeatus]|uniref:cyclin-dependent kinase inhibitor 1C n=1 Tax=Tachyglossus aculeatus TaxID=9261 RepID=UPI0018F67A5B|nr:cyclin-dependent kinase inhibitor 1C [Tachyglossus aculeatus]
MSEVRLWVARPPGRGGPVPGVPGVPGSPGVRRRLFGPVEPAELGREVRALLAELSAQARARWDFDFEADRPLDPRGPGGGPGPRLLWEAEDGAALPAFYRETVHRARPPTPPPGTGPPDGDPRREPPQPPDRDNGPRTAPGPFLTGSPLFFLLSLLKS